MKYIKESKEMQIEKVKEDLSNIINWQMIEDIKDMSLEYLDEGCQLSIFIYLQADNNYTSKTHFYSIAYSHSVKGGGWNNALCNIIQMRDISIDRLRYRINLFSPNDYRKNTRQDLWDLVGRIKRVYKERITMT